MILLVAGVDLHHRPSGYECDEQHAKGCFQIQYSVFSSIAQVGLLYLACRFVPGRAKRLVSKMLAKILVQLAMVCRAGPWPASLCRIVGLWYFMA